MVKLFASTSGTDADWVVKLIDVYPDEVAADPDAGPALDVFVEIAAVHPEKRDDLPQRALECSVQAARLHVDEPGRQIGQQRLESQAILDETLR